MFNDNKTLKLTSFNDNSNYDVKSTNYKRSIIKNNKNKGVSALKEIERLKNEIQNALKNNVVLLNDNEDILSENNYNNIKNKEDKRINNFNSNQTGGFGKQINNNIEIEKEIDIEYNNNQSQNNNYQKSVCVQNERRIKDYRLNDKSTEDTYKRKPFDKFNFK